MATPDFSQYFNNDWSQYLPRTGGYDGKTGGGGFDPSSMGPDIGPLGDVLTPLLKNTVGKVDPIMGLLGGLFGGGGPSWKPYFDEKTGQYVWGDPSKNVPVPLSNVPGTGYKPSGAYRKTAEDVKAIVDLLPYYSKAVSGQIIPEEQAKLAAAQATSPGYNQLSLDLLKLFGPQFSKVGSDIARQEAMQSAENDRAVLAGSGQDLINQLLASQKTIDPEFFSTRAATSDSINRLLASIDPSGALSGSERSEVERSLGQEGDRRGIANAPSSLATVENATRYGKAGADKALKNQSALSQAISAATSFLPASRVGFDPFKVATGKDSTANQGIGKFVGITAPSNTQAGGQAAGIQSGSQQYQLAQMQIDAQKKDWADYLNQVTSSLSDIGGMVGGIKCWLARRAYGEDSPRWKMFRHWLLTKASTSLKELYIKNAEYVAKHLNDAEATKVKTIMDNILEVA